MFEVNACGLALARANRSSFQLSNIASAVRNFCQEYWKEFFNCKGLEAKRWLYCHLHSFSTIGAIFISFVFVSSFFAELTHSLSLTMFPRITICVDSDLCMFDVIDGFCSVLFCVLHSSALPHLTCKFDPEPNRKRN